MRLARGRLHGFHGETQAAAAASLVFDKVTVVDVERGTLLPGQRVVIAGNRIHAVGPAGRVRIPSGAHVVEAEGKYLVPGFWDMHVHPNSSIDAFYPLFIANGVTGIRDAHSEEPLNAQVQWWQEILAGTRVGPPRQLLAGQSFGQQYTNRDSAAVKRIVDSLKAHGANFLKVYPYSSTVAAAARRAGIPFGGHMININYLGGGEVAPETAIEASDGGMRIFDHELETKLSGICFDDSASVERCQPVAERSRRNGSWWDPTVSFSRPIPYTQRARTFLGGAPMRGNWLRDSVPHPKKVGYMHIVQRTGLPVLAGTDAARGLDYSPPGFLIHAELATFVKEGLTPLEALQTATLNPAKLLHGTDSLGTVAPGKLADLVLLDADPLADITNTTTTRAVVANGRYFDRAGLDSLVAKVRTTKWYEQLAKQYEQALQKGPKKP